VPVAPFAEGFRQQVAMLGYTGPAAANQLRRAWLSLPLLPENLTHVIRRLPVPGAHHARVVTGHVDWGPGRAVLLLGLADDPVELGRLEWRKEWRCRSSATPARWRRAVQAWLTVSGCGGGTRLPGSAAGSRTSTERAVASNVRTTCAVGDRTSALDSAGDLPHALVATNSRGRKVVPAVGLPGCNGLVDSRARTP
jgi:hypothetical protein